MTKPLELLQICAEASYKVNYAKSKARGTCIRCGKPAKEFRDASARLEYKISALCQKCQDECFK